MVFYLLQSSVPFLDFRLHIVKEFCDKILPLRIIHVQNCTNYPLLPYLEILWENKTINMPNLIDLTLIGTLKLFIILLLTRHHFTQLTSVLEPQFEIEMEDSLKEV